MREGFVRLLYHNVTPNYHMKMSHFGLAFQAVRFMVRRLGRHQERFIVTMRDIQRYRVVQEVLEGKLRSTQAALILKVSYRHFLPLKQRVKAEGIKGILRPSRASLRKIAPHKVQHIVSPFKNRYSRLNILHFKGQACRGAPDIPLLY